ncbi:MAG: hypothetical protein SPE30_02520 [Candidatus Treponema excrementipullorum]|uniref:Uncharacterized protein n=1 Tax=Candidatus Treponema excrementipullorum TaxID=2838768 RepID=A0A9E2L0X6_9SPIR|nr:hypothetical protein [Candidatus Treponema excrementipullorum]MCI6480110.1 hypothetical protein [Spirochaetia bacterium]MCI7590266.1 hypothetical protein [Spirochaetia bacterium]MDD7013164.1 hypothetical protein [Candidatus Treponema excrementipullorum]MDY4465152.1 hypothetical protein [Candidatus Treponema excrementipullorum]
MLQFYFLSVLLNAIIGLVLLYEKNNDSFDDLDLMSEEQEKGVFSFIEKDKFTLILGLLGALVGFVKLFSVVGDDVLILGDLFPALMGLVGGFAMLLDYYMAAHTLDMPTNRIIQIVFIDKRKIVAIISLVIATLHFIIPQVVFF